MACLNPGPFSPRKALPVVFEYYKLYERLSVEMQQPPRKALKVKIVNATTIDLCAGVFAWAKFRTRKGAMKLHTVLTSLLPQCVLVSDGKTHDRKAVQDLGFQPGELLIFDRAYLDYAWLYGLHQKRPAPTQLGLNWRVPKPTWKVPRMSLPVPDDKEETPATATRVTRTLRRAKSSSLFPVPTKR